jgi:putative tryptophan/tyrosine transport system substrate-binding protein
MRRREFITLVGGAMMTSPFPARAQQQSLPAIGFISSRSMDVDASLLAAFHEGLAQFGFVEGRNVRVEYRWAHGHYDQLPVLAAELVRKPVVVLVSTGGAVAAKAAKAATRTVSGPFSSCDAAMDSFDKKPLPQLGQR